MNNHLTVVNVNATSDDNAEYRKLIQVSHPTKNATQFRDDFAEAFAQAEKQIKDAPPFDTKGNLVMYPMTWDVAFYILEEPAFGYKIKIPEFSEVDA